MTAAFPAVGLRHLCFFEVLGANDEASAEWLATRASLLLLRELDELFEQPPRRAVRVPALRDAVATVARTSPMRAPMEGILDQIENGGMRAPGGLFLSLVKLGDAARRELGTRVAADVFDSVRGYARDRDPSAAREAERRLRRLPGLAARAYTRH